MTPNNHDGACNEANAKPSIPVAYFNLYLNAAPCVVSDVPIAKDKSSRANLGRDKRQVAPNFISDVPIEKDKFSNNSKPDVIHELESTASQTSKSKKKKKSLAVAASMALKKGGLRDEEASRGR
ncbi:hypothetical protein JB92DRAFT_3134142 [Gautieria morchelliformis]|nr:hypothetical protein JB92DRAFT_3134142 [Gautieria morchelliformis]